MGANIGYFALVARKIPPERKNLYVGLFFLGGVSQMISEPKTAKDEFRMAAAGPLSSLVIGGIFLAITIDAQQIIGKFKGLISLEEES